MATTHSILRGDAPQLVLPSKVLERANNLLLRDIPPQRFVTCLYGVLDPATGQLRYAKMFGFPRLAELMSGCSGGPELVQLLLAELDGFTGPDWEQEDDITLVALQRAAVPAVTEASKTPALVS
jgi:serine phosphatase RsbU (regulator of sigma subunit)